MTVLPEGDDRQIREYVVVKQPSRTYRLNMEQERIIGFADGHEAIAQTIACILNTERYENLIYSWNYGVELKDLFGRPLPFVKAEVRRRITEALLQDDRIEAVSGFTFEEDVRALTVAFTVLTSQGALRIEKEVNV